MFVWYLLTDELGQYQSGAYPLQVARMGSSKLVPQRTHYGHMLTQPHGVGYGEVKMMCVIVLCVYSMRHTCAWSLIMLSSRLCLLWSLYSIR